MYVIIRSDLTPAQRTVQAIHAAMESAKAFPQPKQTPNVVVLAVDNEDSLRATWEDLRQQVPVVAYREPDMDNALTAIASIPLVERARHFFSKYRLLR